MADVSAKDGSQVSSQDWRDGVGEDGGVRGWGASGQVTIWECGEKHLRAPGGSVGDMQEEMWVLPALTFRMDGQV